MAISWGTIKSLLMLFGPILIPKGISYYRSIRNAPTIHGIYIRPVPPHVFRALTILFVASAVFLLKTLPIFGAENIFTLTQSRIQTPTDVLFTRLSALRPAGLTANDNLLRGRLNSLDSRLLFFQHGPDVLSECTFCNADDPNSYLYYSLPSILAPHLINLVILALVTSGLLTGKEGAIWRTTATTGAASLALLEIYLVASYQPQVNARAVRAEDLDFFFWKMRVYRGVGLAALDALLGWVLYLSSTNRAFVTPLTTPERIEVSSRILDAARAKLNATVILRNTIQRNEDLRNMNSAYWAHEGQVMGGVMEERAVIEGVNNALENRIDMARISADAEGYVKGIFSPMQGIPGIND
ncbi:uncharacterized protein RAG0_07302 [Rhynchosporium agropyri]|uniref:Chorismate synthase protein n=2 Tax=Rhynchosporium TaxID=38037 RepID=A0A1E1M6E7_RHYSE|nr:uncharacterized protein RAG0_07302 [Rhynchosporium agropyri]CZT44185.1 uncharacterized protein RSE6_04320 [Rhynchosporium secalis]